MVFNNEPKNIAVLSGLSYDKENSKKLDLYTSNLIAIVVGLMQDDECMVSDLALEAHNARCKRVIKYFTKYPE